MATAGRQNHVRLLWRRLLIVILCILCASSILAVWNVYRKERDSSLLRTQAEARLADLEARHDKLVSDIASLETDAGKEHILRNEYDVGKAGERLIVIIDPPASPPAAVPTPWYMRFKWW